MGLNAKQRRKVKLAERRRGESGEGRPGLLNREQSRRRDRALATLVRLDAMVSARRGKTQKPGIRVPSALVVPGEEKDFEKRDSGLLVPGRKRRARTSSR